MEGGYRRRCSLFRRARLASSPLSPLSGRLCYRPVRSVDEDLLRLRVDVRDERRELDGSFSSRRYFCTCRAMGCPGRVARAPGIPYREFGL